MYTLANLNAEIETLIEQMDGVSRLRPDWITHTIMDQHKDIDGADSDFFRCVGREQVRDAVRARLSRYRVTPLLQPDPQMVFEGFNRLQQRYLVPEDGEQVAIRVEDMTGQQRRAKASELRAMGAGCYEHADELDRFDSMLSANAA